LIFLGTLGRNLFNIFRRRAEQIKISLHTQLASGGKELLFEQRYAPVEGIEGVQPFSPHNRSWQLLTETREFARVWLCIGRFVEDFV
jgi:hypothetical protein